MKRQRDLNRSFDSSHGGKDNPKGMASSRLISLTALSAWVPVAMLIFLFYSHPTSTMIAVAGGQPTPLPASIAYNPSGSSDILEITSTTIKA
ncbi:MAG TPA: hypothetical protein PK395_18055, partial [bacterium]|nr:hypothetical protein [bacterium]